MAYLPLNHRTTLNVAETYGTNTSPVIPPTSPVTPPVVVQTSIFHADGERDQYFSSRLYALAGMRFCGVEKDQLYSTLDLFEWRLRVSARNLVNPDTPLTFASSYGK